VRKAPVCKKIIFYQDNAPANKSVLAMGKLKGLYYELLEHPPYSPDLALSDFRLFPKLKFYLAGLRFSSNQEAIAAVERYFADLTKNHYRDGIMALDHRWNKCISLKGDYVETKNQFEIISSFFHCQAENVSEHHRKVP
jgi:histone-lysine N-methyltransferase SETMAR